MYLYNSASRRKEEFVPNHPDIVKMYTCGPTVYHFAHIGNLRTYLMEDVLEKFLRYEGYNVKRVMNITDVATSPPTVTPARTRCSRGPGGSTSPSWTSPDSTLTPSLTTAGS